MGIKTLKILTFGDPVLRKVAKPVSVFHYKLHLTIDSIAYTLLKRADGAALAANQVGVLKRIIVIDYENEFFEMINPEIIESSGNQEDYEGCLSFPGYVGLVNRYQKVKVKFQDRNGNEKIVERSGNLARCFQHEIDHLNGILFIDRMKEGNLIYSKTGEEIPLAEVIDLANGAIKENQSI